jgi:uncharacterized protein (TIGR03435 family)
MRMRAGQWLLRGLASLLLAAAGWAQSFEVASIKPVDVAPCRRVPSPISPAIVSYTHISLLGLIQIAYDLQPEELKSAAWLAEACYDISAKIPTGTGSERVPAMLQQLLGDRFGLRIHWANTTVKGYKLVGRSGGPKLTPAEKIGPDAQPLQATFRGADVEIHFYGVTLDQFARELGRYTGRPTTNATGLSGAYDIGFECSKESIAIFSGNSDPAGAEPGMSLYTAVRGLGLDLVPANVTQRRLVVDAVSRAPVAN